MNYERAEKQIKSHKKRFLNAPPYQDPNKDQISMGYLDLSIRRQTIEPGSRK